MGRCFFQGYPFENESKDVINIIIHCRRPAEKFGSSFCHSECNSTFFHCDKTIRVNIS